MTKLVINTRNKLLALSVAGLGLPMTAMPVSAEQALALEEVIVSAQRRDESLQDAPVSISAFSGEALDKLGFNSVEDLSGHAPNVTLIDGSGSSSNLTVGMRGIYTSDPVLALPAKVGLYVDGVYMARVAGAITDMVEIERIEVLRGPQGTLWGKNTTGGAINFVSQKPSGEFAAKIDTTIGNYDYYRVSATVDTDQVAGFSAKISATTTERDGTVDNSNPAGVDTFGNDDSNAYRVALRWEASDNLMIDYAYDRSDKESSPNALQLSAINPAASASPVAFDVVSSEVVSNPYHEALSELSSSRRDELNSAIAREEKLEAQGHNLTAELDLGPVILKSITALREIEGEIAGNDFDGGTYSRPLFEAADDWSQQQKSQEFQVVNAENDSSISYIAGLYYFEEQAEQTNPQNFTAVVGYNAGLPLIFTGNSVNAYETDNESLAAYGQLTFSPETFDDRLKLSFGLRYTEDEKTVVQETLGVTGSDSWDNVSGAFSAFYDVSDDVSVYAKVAQGYNAGTYNARAQSVESFLDPADEETLVNYELGIKSELWDRRLRLNGAVFVMDYDDLQVSQFVSGEAGASTVVTNAGRARISGFEFDAVALLSESLTATMSWGYTDVDILEYITSVDNTTGVIVDSADQAKQPFTPNNTGSLSLDYVFAPMDIGELSFNIGAQYTDEMVIGVLRNTYDSLKARTLFNARLSLSEIELGERARARVSLWGKNIFDKEYRVRGVDFGVDDSSLPFAVNNYGDPATYGVDFTVEF